MLKTFLAIFVLVGGVSTELRSQEPAVAKELIQYVRDAKKAGLKEAEIQQNAVKAGWPAASVVTAMASLSAAATKPAGSAAPAKQELPPKSLPAPAVAHESPKDHPVSSAAVAPPTATPTIPKGSQDAASAKPPSLSPNSSDEYRIGEGDVLQISVWGERDASVPSVVVRHDGQITIPLVKQIRAAGLTPTELENIIAEQLSKMITAPDVTVVVTQVNSKKVFMVGAVKKEGPIAYTYHMTVMQAISEAGGLTDYAKPKGIYVLRAENGRQFRLPFNYSAVLHGLQMEMNIALQPGDTVVVPK